MLLFRSWRAALDMVTHESALGVTAAKIGRTAFAITLKPAWLVKVRTPDAFAQALIECPSRHVYTPTLPFHALARTVSLHPIAAGLGAQPQQTPQFQNAQPSLFVRLHWQAPFGGRSSAPPSQFLLDALSGEDATPGARSEYSPLPLKDDLSEVVSTHPKSSSRLRIRQVAGWRTPFHYRLRYSAGPKKQGTVALLNRGKFGKERVETPSTY